MRLLSFIPNNVISKLILLILGALAFSIVAVVVVKNKKKMPPEVWISLTALCVLGMAGAFLVFICTASLFVIAD